MDKAILLQTAIEAARAGGAVALDRFDETQQIHFKGPRDLTTETDLQVQARIKEVIRERFPHHGFLAEEADGTLPQPAEYQWIIDPIDGTTNYSRRFPFFSVSVALSSHEGQPLLGVVYDPLRKMMFQAHRGSGARLNGERIRVSTTDELGRALVGMEWSRDPVKRDRNIQVLARLAPQVWTLRGAGSAALSLCYVASGWLDLYVHLSLSPWDIAAAGLIIEEAGGKVTNLVGAPWTLDSGEYLATNALLHDAALKLLEDAAF